MNFLNLGLGELLGLAGVISAGVVALYLLDRSKKRQVVSTLRFWVASDVRTELKHRRRIQQPWSLLLQIISLILLLTAIAGPQLGVFDTNGRDHVLVLDTSAWMGSRVGQGILIDQAKAAARAYVRGLPRKDRVMVVRADALATPATAFESNHEVIDGAIQDSQPGASALNLEQALSFSERAQQLQSRRPGEIVFIGAGKVAEEESTLMNLPKNLRVITTKGAQENIGLRKIGLRRSLSSPDSWDIFVVSHNYGVRPQTIDLALKVANSPAGARRISIAPGADEQESFSYETKTAGWVEARLNVRDAFPQDDRAAVQLPSQSSSTIVVYSNEPQLLKPLFGSIPEVQATFETPDKYDPSVKADIVVLDRFTPPSSPRTNAIWIEPPASGSPIPVRGTLTKIHLDTWRMDSILGAGLRTKDVTLESSEVFTPSTGDIVVADTAPGPVMVARAGEHKQIVLGFQLGRGAMKYELAVPLLVANTLRWMTPGSFRRWEVQAGTVGTVNVPVDKGTSVKDIQVHDETDRALPFTLEDDVLRFFSGAPGNVHVQLGDREIEYSLTLPDVGESTWNVPATVAKGIPRTVVSESLPTDLWPWLAILGGLGLFVDWLLYGRSRAFRLRAASMASPLTSRVSSWRKAS